MDRLLRRLSIALLCGFGTFVVALPVGCGMLLLYSEHWNGGVQSGGPQSMLGGMALALVLATMVGVGVFVGSKDKT